MTRKEKKIALQKKIDDKAAVILKDIMKYLKRLLLSERKQSSEDVFEKLTHFYKVTIENIIKDDPQNIHVTLRISEAIQEKFDEAFHKTLAECAELKENKS